VFAGIENKKKLVTLPRVTLDKGSLPVDNEMAALPRALLDGSRQRLALYREPAQRGSRQRNKKKRKTKIFAAGQALGLLLKKLFKKKEKKSLLRACTGALGKEIIQKKEKIFAESQAPGLSAKKLSKKKKKKSLPRAGHLGSR
jgi:hypothetical protein